LAKRIVWTGAFVALAAIAYAALAFAGRVPVPRSVASLEREGAPHNGYALVSGYYITLPFVANGNGLPPYAFGETSAAGGAVAPAVHVSPALSDLRAYRVVALIDTATGDGSEWNPYVIHTVGSVTVVVVAALAGGLMVIALLFWLAGYAAGSLTPQPARGQTRRAAG
jgi:hypothetical protein